MSEVHAPPNECTPPTGNPGSATALDVKTNTESGKNTRKVREISQAEQVGTMNTI